MFSATSGTPARVSALIRGTGSELDSEGLDLYRRLVADRDHADATLLMMAQWELDGLLKSLPALTARTLLIAGERDKTVPPDVSQKAAQQIPGASFVLLKDVGHLAHEEDPEQVARHILDFLEN